MAKLTKKADILESLHKLVTKEAEMAQTNISGEPGKDTNFTSVSEKTEHTDKNSVGPEHLNSEQGYKQEDSKDPSEPVATAKSASEVDPVTKMANDIMETIKSKLAETAQTNIKGTPGADTNISSVSDKTEHTDKNSVGPDKLDKDQGYKQEGSKDPSEPVANAKKAEEAQKQASRELGGKFCEILMSKAANMKNETELLKEAGRRDFDTLIAQAAAELENQQKEAAYQEKIAEEQGAAAFDEMYKQAQYSSVVEENNQLRAKLAEYIEFEKQAMQKQAAIAEEAKFSKMADLVFEKIKNELKATAEAPVK